MVNSACQNAEQKKALCSRQQFHIALFVILLTYTFVLVGCDAVSSSGLNARSARLVSRSASGIGRGGSAPEHRKPAKPKGSSGTSSGGTQNPPSPKPQPTPTPQPKPPAPTTNSDPALSSITLLGISYGNSGWAMSNVSNMEAWQGKKFATVELFSSWCPGDSKRMDNLFNIQLMNIWKNGNIPVLTWQPYICSASTTPTNVDALIASGAYDSYLNQFAARVKSFVSGSDGILGTSDDRRLYIRLGHEMNGNWYSWSANSSGQTPAQFVAMWRHVHSAFEAQGINAAHLQWIWCVGTKDSNQAYPAEQYYPGDAYVDWLGLDGYNFGDQTFGPNTFSWRTPQQVFSAMLTRMRALATKPIGIMETGSSATTSSGVNLAAKNQWVGQLFAYALAEQIKMVVWFNHDAPLWGTSCCRMGDWGVFGGTLGDASYTAGASTYLLYSAYKPAVAAAEFVSAEQSNARLLTDTQFIGR